MAWNLDNYEPVADRIERFRKEYPLATIETELISEMGGNGYRFKALIDIEGVLVATGHAEELISARGVNQAHALENAETSAVGRALANFGLRSVGGIPTKEDMQNVETRNQAAAEKVSERQKTLLELINSQDEQKQTQIKQIAKDKHLPSLRNPLHSEALDEWQKILEPF